MKKLILAVPFAMALAFSPAAYAQQSGGLVTVVIDDTDIANDLNLQASLPINVEVPIGIAANVCDTNASVLAQEIKDEGSAECTAKNSSQAFANLVSRQQN